jgi:hypothetical protein
LFNDTVRELYKSEFQESYLNPAKFITRFKRWMEQKLEIKNKNSRLQVEQKNFFGKEFPKDAQPRGWDIPGNIRERLVRADIGLTQMDFRDTA